MRLVIGYLIGFVAVQAAAITGGATPCECPTQWDAVGALGFSFRLGQEPWRKGATDHDWHCATTLAAPDVIVTARHCVYDWLGLPFHVRFRRAVDGSIGSVAAGVGSFAHARVVSWHLPDCGDVALGYLDAPVSHIAPMPVLFDPGLASGAPLGLGAWGREGPAFGSGARERLMLCSTAATGAYPASYIYFPSAPPVGEPGCGTNSNDSGGTVTEMQNGELRLVGVITGSSDAAHLARCAADPQVAALARPWPYAWSEK